MSSSEIVTVPQSGVEKRVRVRFPEHRRGRTLNQPPYKHMLGQRRRCILATTLVSQLLTARQNEMSLTTRLFRSTHPHRPSGCATNSVTKSPRRFGPPDAKSGQPTCVNASEQGTQKNIRAESYLPERMAVP
ncbi:hypothetical protein T07_994 [Trichinella nelsoni]|uniref:Uncharacterized protein n=1 Tax=Trichinella nelsoni TaxID=6336 RepID=A0A0V0SFR6_9BILA|nr:hypothetical protein T07_994 [Trichinella nelsoni]